MDFGLMTEPQLGMTYGELLDAARICEANDLAVFARSDHYTFPRFEAPHATDAFATLGGLARETSRVGLCVLVSPITFRHPGVIAKSAATIDEMSGGRLLLGVGTGWMEEEHAAFGLPFPDVGERFARLEEALAYLWAAFGRSPGGFDGEFYSITSDEIRPLPTGDLPIVVGGTGPRRTPRLAGTYADEYNMAVLASGEIAARVTLAREAAEAAGRDPEALRVSVMGGAITGTDEASFRRNLEQIAAAHPLGRSPEQIESSMRERGLPVGPGDEARAALRALEDAGVTRFYLQHFGPFAPDLLAEQFAVLSG
jgi:alkanesulfonate monooxygenase SsuD/methylene tetrahydromethanopterin reductase-like flavin-dependent oxidoreductase (luciferase family)